MNDILAVEGVNKSFGSLRAVDQVSFAVEPGEIFGIAGPNGSGKSTLFNIMTSIPFPSDAGRIVFDGTAIQRMRPNEICRAGIARTFQKETAFDSLSAFDNVRVGSVYGHAPGDRGEVAQACRKALDSVGIEPDQFDRPASELSVFDKKRLMLASALASGPRLLLMDEPASGLTKPEIDQTVDLIRKVNAEGVTVLVIEHVLPLLLTVSQRLMVLNQGEVLVIGAPEQVMKDERVVEAYLGSRARHD